MEVEILDREESRGVVLKISSKYSIPTKKSFKNLEVVLLVCSLATTFLDASLHLKLFIASKLINLYN